MVSVSRFGRDIPRCKIKEKPKKERQERKENECCKKGTWTSPTVLHIVFQVIGQDRSPEMTDKADMPYIEATINETLRLSSTGEYVSHKSTISDPDIDFFSVNTQQ